MLISNPAEFQSVIQCMRIQEFTSSRVQDQGWLIVLAPITRARPTMLITNDNGIHYFKTNEPADHRARIGGGLMTGANHPTNGLGMRSPLENMSSRRSCIAFLFLHSSFLSWVNRCINHIYHTQKSKRNKNHMWNARPRIRKCVIGSHALPFCFSPFIPQSLLTGSTDA